MCKRQYLYMYLSNSGYLNLLIVKREGKENEIVLLLSRLNLTNTPPSHKHVFSGIYTCTCIAMVLELHKLPLPLKPVNTPIFYKSSDVFISLLSE